MDIKDYHERIKVDYHFHKYIVEEGGDFKNYLRGFDKVEG